MVDPSDDAGEGGPTITNLSQDARSRLARAYRVILLLPAKACSLDHMPQTSLAERTRNGNELFSSSELPFSSRWFKNSLHSPSRYVLVCVASDRSADYGQPTDSLSEIAPARRAGGARSNGRQARAPSRRTLPRAIAAPR
eukprot:6125630-Prymnesium_polylepis.1